MDRRSFLKTSALGGTAAAAATLAAPAYAQGNVKLTMVASWPRGFAGVWDAAERVAASVNAMSGGSLQIELKAAGELVGALEVFDAVSSGQADIYHSADYYFVGQHPGLAFFTAVPFGMTAPEYMAWYYSQGGIELHHELGEIFGLKSFAGGQTGAQGGGWFRKEMKSVEDFQGLKFRMPGFGGQALGKLGASVQNIPGGEIYQALASGALDGTEWIGPWADEKMGLQEVTKFFYMAGFHEPGAALSVSVNLDTFNGLSAAHQKIIEIASLEAHQFTYALYIANNGAALDRLIAGGVKAGQFSDEIWDAYGKASKEVMDSFMDDELYAKIRASYETGMAAASGWLSKSDGFYTAQLDRVLAG